MLKRCIENPILSPRTETFWEACAVFNPCVTKLNNRFVMLYRAMSKIPVSREEGVDISCIGIAKSDDGINFEERDFFFGPEYGYEIYACEDPRITKINGKYFVFYTAVSKLPPDPRHVKLACAVTEDFKEYEKLGVVCPFNSKAGVVFPEKINGRYCLMFTLYPDLPPARIGVAFFDRMDEILTREYWEEWMKNLELEKNYLELDFPSPFVEIGTPPVATDEGWLMFVPEIIYEQGTFIEFRISALLLDLENPLKIVAKTKKPLLYPETSYETRGDYPKGITFPSGATVINDKIYVYYNGADKFCCIAYCELDKLLKYLMRGCRV